MKNERLFEALEKIDEELIDEAAPGNKPPKKKVKTATWVKWGAMAACTLVIVGIGAPLIFNHDGTVTDGKPETEGNTTESPNDTMEPSDGPSNLVVNGISFLISPHMAVFDKLPEGFTQVGETNVGGFEGCPYYVNPDIPEWVYVYHEVMTDGKVDETGTLIRTEPHNAYVRYVDERLRGKDLVSYNGDYFISMWSVEYYGDTPDISEEYYNEMESLYGIRIEGDAPDGFTCVGTTEFSGHDSIPRGVLSSNQGAYEVFASDNDVNVIFVSTQWHTATSDEQGETIHEGYNVYIRYDCPLD